MMPTEAPPPARASAARPAHGRAGGVEEGTGLVGSLTGLLVALVLLLFAVETLVGLYARSTLTAAAHDAARAVASDQQVRAGDGEARQAVAAAEADLVRELGESTSTRWSIDDDQVVLWVRVPKPGFLPAGWRGPDEAGTVELTARVRVEALR